jgi:Holliday junction resolvase-like predicted endonuclease
VDYSGHKLDELYRLTFRDLKAATNLAIESSQHHVENSKLLKDLCSYFGIEEDVGVSRKANVVCPSWGCQYLNKCREKCIDECLVLNENVTLYSNSPPEIITAKKRLAAEIDKMADSLSPQVVISGLSHIAEESLLLAVTESPMELFAALRIRKWLYERYGKLNLFRLDPEPSYPFDREIKTIWEHFLALIMLDVDWPKIDNGDAVIFASPEGKIFIDALPQDPTAFIRSLEKDMAEMESSKTPPRGKYLWHLFWTKRMLPVLKWCFNNMMPVQLDTVTLVEQKNAIYKHIAEVGRSFGVEAEHDKEPTIKPAECLRLGLPLYTALFHVIRYAALNDPFFAEVISEYQGIHETVEQICHVDFSPFFWDNTVFKLSFNTEHKSTIMPSLNLKDSQNAKWPIDDGMHALRGSAIVLAFASKNYSDVTAKNNKVGFYFEDIVIRELHDRKIPIVARNISILDGEIDVICFDSLWFYIIEAKDYGPRGSAGYFSSQDYSRRNEELLSYLNKFEARLQWAKGNKAQIGVPENAQLLGVFLTSFEEPHIEAPAEILIVNHKRLCGLFGGSPIDPLFKYSDSELKPSMLRKEAPIQKAKRGESEYKAELARCSHHGSRADSFFDESSPCLVQFKPSSYIGSPGRYQKPSKVMESV